MFARPLVKMGKVVTLLHPLHFLCPTMHFNIVTIHVGIIEFYEYHNLGVGYNYVKFTNPSLFWSPTTISDIREGFYQTILKLEFLNKHTLFCHLFYAFSILSHSGFSIV